MSDRPFVAGMYDYYLGGTANSAADRAAVEQLKQLTPEVIDTAWANRGFLQRAVKRMAQEWGIRQFLDIGAGLPTQRNTHDVVAEVTPEGRVVYVDIDPRVIARGHEMLAGVEGTAAILGDVREPDRILRHPETQRLIDFSEPVGLLLVAVLHFVPDSDDPWGLVTTYLDALVPGSYLAVSAFTADRQAEHIVNQGLKIYQTTSTPSVPRTKAQVERFFTGLEIVPPYDGAGAEVTYAGMWGAEDPVVADSDGSRWIYAAVARKP